MPLASRYIRTKIFLKFIYFIATILVITILYDQLQPRFLKTHIQTKKISSSHNHVQKNIDRTHELVISNPTFAGVNKDLEPYTIKATKVNKISENKFDLRQVDACYKIGNDQFLIEAQIGFFDVFNQLIFLKEDVKFFFDNFLLNTEEIYINLVNKEASTNTPVRLSYKNSEINADNLSLKGNNIALFRGNVLTKINILDF